MTLYGTLYQKGNSRIIFRHKYSGKMMNIKKPQVQKAMGDMIVQARNQWKGKPIETPCSLMATIFYPSNRHDLDCTLLCDILQKADVVKNDRLIEHINISKQIDRARPRVELSITPLEGRV